VVSDEVPLVVSRQLLQTFAQELGKLDPEAEKEIAQYALAQIQPRVVSFEEQVCTSYLYQPSPFYVCYCFCQGAGNQYKVFYNVVTNWVLVVNLPLFILDEWLIYQVLIIREKLAELYESEQQWSQAAKMLSGIDLDSGIRYINKECVVPLSLFSMK
jgi:hypothetical protein